MTGENRYEARGDAVFLGRACIAICDTENLPKAKNEANARLFAAAPDLLWFTQQIIRGVECGNIKIESPTSDETLANILARGRRALTSPEAR